ncbi:hypothetical protein BDM02DRAFT_3123435 [Thelephora ganbajun]|uniref:Uncharacterized protein n=1 Tax=Thelephora ganbajun TaxID=370292 RepID=A0ACB6Z2T6_THEGA|nr:hypothetical protein BDM02DRAFT_3123435 [Thelephora ganbajun]
MSYQLTKLIGCPPTGEDVEWHSRLEDRISRLYGETQRFRAKTIRAPKHRSRAVEAAASKAVSKSEARSNAWRIKRPASRIGNQVRDLPHYLHQKLSADPAHYRMYTTPMASMEDGSHSP